MHNQIRVAVTKILLLLAPVILAPVILADGDDPFAVPRWHFAQQFDDLPDWLDGGVVEPTWLEDGSSFFFVETSGGVERILEVNPLATAGARIRQLEAVPKTGEPAAAPRLVRAPITDGSPSVFEKPSPDGRFALSEVGPQLALRHRADGRLSVLTDDGTKDFPWQIGDARWAPRGFLVAALRVDRRRVPKEPVVHWLQTTPEVTWLPNSRTGQPLERPHLFLIDTRSGDRVEVEVGDQDRYLFTLGWSPDGEHFRFLQTSRLFDRVRLRQASRDGSVTTLLDETTDTFFGALRFMTYDAERVATFLDQGSLAGHFLWISQEADGWRQLTLHAPDGRAQQRLTHGAFEVQEVLAVDEERSSVLLLANAEPGRPYDTHLYRVGLDGSGFRRLTEGEGEHQVVLSPSKKFFLDTWSSPDRLPRVELRDVDGNLLETLSEARLEMPDDLPYVAAEAVSAPAADGVTKLYGWLFKPHDFDPTRSYPVVDYIYNGPFITWAPQTFTDRRAVQGRALAELGFVVLVMDGRATPERGKAFQDVVYRAFGHHETDDHAAFLRAIAKDRPWLDLDRVGITGGSWGGYMTVRAMLLYPEFFTVGVAMNSVYDLEDHNAAIEGYVGLPQDEIDSYAQSSNFKIADRLRGHLLLIHGTLDVNATFSATMKMAHALIEADRAFDLLIVPEQSHWFTGQARTYSTKARARYLVEHLRPEP